MAELRPTPVRIARWLLTRAVLLLLVINGVMYLQQPRITFYPFPEHESDPSHRGLSYEDVTILVEGEKVHGWYLPHPAADKTLLFFHGNGGNISHRIESLLVWHRLGLNVLIIDYRGYGHSEGEPSEQGLYRDARAAWDYLLTQRGLRPGQIIIFGRSLGGAVATDLAARVEPAALILESTFSSARDVSKVLFPRLSHLLWLRYRFDSSEKIKRIKSPLLMLHSTQDELIPYPLGRKLFAAAPQPKAFVALRGGHNDGFLLSQPHYERSLAAFLQRLNG